mgnify:CR=1 FL=1
MLDHARRHRALAALPLSLLLASLTLIAGIGVIVGLPFALRAGAEFFLPVTAALVVAIALVPIAFWVLIVAFMVIVFGRYEPVERFDTVEVDEPVVDRTPDTTPSPLPAPSGLGWGPPVPSHH